MSTPHSDRPDTAIYVRIPRDVHEWLKKQANDADVSLVSVASRFLVQAKAERWQFVAPTAAQVTKADK
jgi:predicted HicB family RNase H-like nuclease